MPLGKASEVVIELHVHVCDHPLCAASVAVVPSAETTSLLWPDVNHLSGEVGWIGKERSNEVRRCQEAKLDIVVTEVVVNVQEIESLLQPMVVTHHHGPVDHLISSKREASSE